MTHDHSHGQGSHSHSHAHVPAGVTGKTMGAAMALTLTFVLAEAFFGWRANSLALLSDAGHNFTDAGALGLSWYALWIAGKAAHKDMTFGYHRVAVLAALINALSLVVIAGMIAWEALVRLRHPEVANGPVMMVVAAIGIVTNLTIGFWLHAGAHDDINVRSAYLHMMGDAVAALGVVIAGAIMAVTDAAWADPVVSLLISALILYSSAGIVRESTTVLLEGTPPGMDMPAVIRTICGVTGVIGVHDLHVWMVGPGVVACSCHIVVGEQSIREGQQVLKSVVHEMAHHFSITHTTIQVEVEGCPANDMYCSGNTAHH